MQWTDGLPRNKEDVFTAGLNSVNIQNVDLCITLFGEGFEADLALEGLFSSVSSSVLLHVAFIFPLHSTNFTKILLGWRDPRFPDHMSYWMHCLVGHKKNPMQLREYCILIYIHNDRFVQCSMNRSNSIILYKEWIFKTFSGIPHYKYRPGTKYSEPSDLTSMRLLHTWWWIKFLLSWL